MKTDEKILFAVISVSLLPLLMSCGGVSEPGSGSVDYRQEMRDFVIDIAAYGRGLSPGFIVVPQNGQELLTADGEPDGSPMSGYVAAIDGQGREDLYFGYLGDDLPTPQEEVEWMEGFLDLAEARGVQALVTDYCSTRVFVDSSYALSQARGYVSFAADHRSLDNIPAYPAQPWNANVEDVSSLSQAKNFLYLIDDSQFSSADEFVSTLSATDYDLLIIDLFCSGEELTPSQLEELGGKGSGGDRLVLCYMSIGEAEDYRWYWDPSWTAEPPSWLGPENPDWPGNYLVDYWNSAWQSLIYGSEEAYLDRILEAGFDGVYLDKIDSFESYE
jgi:cysteinyl-tRNA synthetase, unknown class